MKKIIYVLMFSMIVVGLAACSPSTTENPTGSNSNTINYSEEIPDLPILEGMTLEEFTEGEDEYFSDAHFLVEGKEFESFLADYKEILVGEGWEVIDEELPITLSVQKEDRISVFLASEADEGIILMVLSK
ncbi:hypothetical protein [Alkaliphilus peptidifermentans]|uniref:Lipoprotein n=1 Tax=Alkaliphilus peptidifermentans DSM 18978 TaxID=1120976 RepID=A0A1G5AIH5_9FIRM|nr:hypothetical protein [Alkaliphilus peptidifermentans]SCX77694.1 hypothetical protein SAMN03080606_00152 [Alkaliphilus peptidifermentans DSM 18978]